MRKYFTTVLFAAWSLAIYGQIPTLDSLLVTVEKQKGEEKAATLIQLSHINLEIDLGKAKKYADQAKSISVEVKNPSFEALANLAIGDVLVKKFDNERAMALYMDAWKTGKELEDKPMQGQARVRIGEVYSQMEDFVQGEEYLVKAIELGEGTNNLALQAKANKSLGSLYLKQEIYGRSLNAFNRAVDLFLSLGKREKAAAITMQLGDISTDLGNRDGALAYFQTSLNLHQETGNIAKVGEVNRKISIVLLAQKDVERAYDFAQQAFWMARSQEDSLGQAMCLKNFALIYKAKKKTSKSKEYLEESIGFLNQLEITPEVPATFQEIAEVYGDLGDHKNAYRNHVAFSDTRKEYFNKEKSKALLDLTTKYESEFEAKEKQQQIELLKVENAHSRNVTYFLYTVVGLIGMLLFTYYSSYKQKQRDNLALQEQNEEIRRQDEEITLKNVELETKNISLDLLNKNLLSEIAERENVEKSSFARDRFLATMSHEMRTPLNVITGLTHILLKERPRNDQIEHLRTLQFSANDLVVFINDILDFSKIEAGKLHTEDREFAPQKVVKEIRNRFVERAEEYDLQFDFSFDNKIPEMLLGDDARLHQIMTNLLTNSFQHTEEGYIKVDVALNRLDQKEAMLQMVVEGSDKGYNRQNIDEMFSSMMDKGDGFEGYNGQEFSLSITKRLIELQNGKIEVEVRKGMHTKFMVLLPFKLPKEKNTHCTDTFHE